MESYISRAKINWRLKVGPIRDDGFHGLETVFQELELGETVSVGPNGDGACHLTGFPPDINPDSNLVTRAWKLLKSYYPDQVGGLDFRISKTLPHGGGIGGGSSNAACALTAINKLYDLNLSEFKLQEIAGQLGSDVAFFVKGGTAVGTGRGEILDQLPPAPVYWLVLIMPNERMSTPEAYRVLDDVRKSREAGEEKHTLSSFLTALSSGDPLQLADAIENDFELVAQGFEWFNSCQSKLNDAGALRAFLCGSGSTVAGLAKCEESAREIAQTVGGIYTRTRG